MLKSFQNSLNKKIITNLYLFSSCKNCAPVRQNFIQRVRHILKRNKGQIHQLIYRQPIQFSIQFLQAYHFANLSKQEIAMPAFEKILGNTKEKILQEDFNRVKKIFNQLEISMPQSLSSKKKVVSNKNIIQFENGSTVTLLLFSPQSQDKVQEHYDLFFHPREFQIDQQNQQNTNFQVSLKGNKIESYFMAMLKQNHLKFTKTGQIYSVPSTLPPNRRRDFQTLLNFVKYFNPSQSKIKTSEQLNLQIRLLGIPTLFVSMLQFNDCTQMQLNRALKAHSYGNFLGSIRLMNKYQDRCNQNKLHCQQSHHYVWNFASKTKMLPTRVQSQHQTNLIHQAALERSNTKILALVQQRFYLNVLNNLQQLSQQKNLKYKKIEQTFKKLQKDQISMTQQTVSKMITVNSLYEVKGSLQRLFSVIENAQSKKDLKEFAQECNNAKTLKPLVSDPQTQKWKNMSYQKCPLICLNMMGQSSLQNFMKINAKDLDDKQRILRQFVEKLNKNSKGI